MFLQPMPKREREKKNAFAVLLCIHYIKEKAFAHWHHCYSKGPCSHPKSLYISLAVSFFYEAGLDVWAIKCIFLFPLVTQPMLQRQPNCTELRSMDFYIQILFRFQKCKGKVPPSSLLNNERLPFTFLVLAYVF